MARKNKSKKEIVSDIQLVQDAERRRSLVKDLIFPYLLTLGENIEYSKLFLQSVGGLVNTTFEETGKTTTIGHLEDKLHARLAKIFDVKVESQKKEYERYVTLLNNLKDISVQDLAYAVELGRYIDGYILKSKGKDLITTIPLDEIMGK